ncbi:uncharacterized protein EDB91DRAFT_1088912 [Suillus paluster]|uniref:uncharacterized protein n=1 Tax=Suillus paluster TaxID=48578 RepID=UPI001B868641|nr:uncharacterized protein EDB91DRAFT_1088912 [Suillus paluster]KAG1720196.1 hypothetical protein EDB91DRAFT_1088912 [Suillus paluster]
MINEKKVSPGTSKVWNNTIAVWESFSGVFAFNSSSLDEKGCWHGSGWRYENVSSDSGQGLKQMVHTPHLQPKHWHLGVVDVKQCVYKQQDRHLNLSCGLLVPYLMRLLETVLGWRSEGVRAWLQLLHPLADGSGKQSGGGGGSLLEWRGARGWSDKVREVRLVERLLEVPVIQEYIPKWGKEFTVEWTMQKATDEAVKQNHRSGCGRRLGWADGRRSGDVRKAEKYEDRTEVMGSVIFAGVIAAGMVVAGGTEVASGGGAESS